MFYIYMEDENRVEPQIDESDSEKDEQPYASSGDEEEVVPAPILKTKSSATIEEEKAVRKKKESEAVLRHCERMRELKKSKPPSKKEYSKTVMKQKAKEIQREVVKQEAKKIDKLYEEVVEKKSKPQLKPAASPPPPTVAPPSFRDMMDIKSYYKKKYKSKYGATPLSRDMASVSRSLGRSRLMVFANSGTHTFLSKRKFSYI
jgi:hypothetical protein